MSAASAGNEGNERRWIGVFLFDVMEEIDGIGPWEVFAWWTNHFPEDGWSATTFSMDGKPVRCEKTLVVCPHHSFESLPPLDVLVHPGGDGAQAMVDDPAHLLWLREQRGRIPLLTSVCSGALPLAAAGLLRGRPATTAMSSFETMRSIDDSIDVREGERFVDDGDVVTAAGLSAGIDMALHIVGRLVSPERSRQVRDGIEYAPEPPH